jgi:hypothetical protein
MEINLDFSRLEEWFGLSPLELIKSVFVYGGWIVLAIGVLIGLYYLRLYLKRHKYLHGIKQVMLAIDIPKDNEQSLVAVEQLFATLHGIKSDPNDYQKYWLGYTQLYLSLEIVSLEGYIQFLIRTPEAYREVVESAIYAQYPGAEITEVEDYIKLIPSDVHEIKSDYNVWAAELNLAKPSAYPLKTYKYFEHSLPGVFIDPMASLLEVMSKIGPGEQLCLQLIILPVNDDWKETGRNVVKELIGDKVKPKDTFADKLSKGAKVAINYGSESVYKMWGDIKEKPEEKLADKNSYMYLTTNQKMTVEKIEDKLGKMSFACTFRFYYLAHNDVFKIGRGVNAFFGALNQFNSSDLNSFKSFKPLMTVAKYFFVKTRVSRIQKRFLKFYKERSMEGSPEFFLGTEELATLYHFPTITVKAPLLQWTGAKKAEPPSLLPLSEIPERQFFKTKEEVETVEDLPVEESGEEEDYKITSSLPGYDFDNDYFEEHFGKKTANVEQSIEKKSTHRVKPASERKENFESSEPIDKNLPPNLPIAE